jgi:hypothetical protein
MSHEAAKSTKKRKLILKILVVQTFEIKPLRHCKPAALAGGSPGGEKIRGI